MQVAPLLPFHVRPVSADEDAETLRQVLRRIGCWARRSELQRQGYLPRWTERRFRGAANASKGQIIGGSKGYCLTSLASVADVEHAERALQSQARKMTQRAVEIRRARNAHVT